VSASPSSPIAPASGDNARGGPASTPPRELERKLIDSVVAKLDVARLPGMPIIIDRALRASRRERDASQLCEWLALDPSLTFRVLEATSGPDVAGAASDELSLAQRVGAMKQGLVRPLLMSAARCSLGPDSAPLSARELGEFWIHALRVAFLSRTLAEACSYRDPDEAYLAGLLHDLGSFALLATVPNTLRSLVATQANAPWGAIPEHAGRLGTIHSQIGAALLERLRVPFYVSDSVLLHHAPSAELVGTHPLVRILCCAEALAHSRSPAVPHGAIADLLQTPASAVSAAEKAAAEKVSAVLRGLGRLGLTKAPGGRAGPADAAEPASGPEQRLTETLVMRFVKEAQQPAAGDASLERKSDREPERSNDAGDDTAEEQAWSEALALHATNATAGSILDQIAGEAVRSEAATLLRHVDNIPLAVAEVLPLARVVAGVKCAVLFLAGDELDANWLGWLVDGEGARRVALELSTAGQSLVARAARAADALTSSEEGKASQLTGLDLQIARLLSAEEIAAVPLNGGGTSNRGVVVFGSNAMKASRFAQILPFLCDLTELVARTPSQRGAAPAERSDESAAQMRASTRRLVHEARNPLSVLKTYLQIARTRAEGGESLQKELEIANQEVERVARLLDEIGTPNQAAAPRVQPVEVNRTIEDLLLLYGEALFVEKKIALSPMLDPSILPISCDEEGLKQVLLNLLLNASEALSSGGQVLVCTSDHVNYEGQVMVEISVADNGPGMPPEKVAGLFTSSAVETKDAARGVGLPTSLAVVKAMGGHLVCRSRLGEGTTFSILLPRTAGGDPQSAVSASA